jgi:hypothetical protein
LALAVLAFLFWRLDKRSRLLIKFAEDYLYEDEAKLANALSTDKIKIASAAHKIRGTARWWRFASFGQVYDVSFLLLGVTGLALFVKG